jgi:hypothetical protein
MLRSIYDGRFVLSNFGGRYGKYEWPVRVQTVEAKLLLYYGPPKSN